MQGIVPDMLKTSKVAPIDKLKVESLLSLLITDQYQLSSFDQILEKIGTKILTSLKNITS